MSLHPIAAADKLVRSRERHRYRLDVQYDGTEFSGMQWQPDRRTVQRCLEDALEPLFESAVRVFPSSRTDAGVHAAGQVVHIDAPVKRSLNSIVRAGNVGLPPDVRILSAQEVDETFHARFSATWRGYRYRISHTPIAIGRSYSWQFLQPIDVPMLQPLAEQIIGTHFFSAFSHENPVERHNYQSTVLHSSWNYEGSLLVYRIEANRFLHGMVRLLVGTMVDIASGRGSVQSLTEVLVSCDNRKAGTKAPACGLTLESVGYHEWPEL